MLPYQTLISLTRGTATGLGQQLTAAFIRLIQQGVLAAGAQLPGTRTLSTLLAVHRQTIVAAFDELEAQGWIEQRPSKGAIVSRRIPEVQPLPLPTSPALLDSPRAGFSFTRSAVLAGAPQITLGKLTLDSGCPDARLAPLAALARKYRTICRPTAPHRRPFGYTDANGPLTLRHQLVRYLHETRGVAVRPETLFITRGSGMAMYLATQLVLQPGDVVVVGERSYPEADRLFQYRGAQLARVPVDANGLDVAAVEALCRRQRVRLLYITPHHHYPTTVTLSAERRVRLLQLAEQYDFIILEDDYDFDYHYASSPILPLASADRNGRVLYVGSMSKVLAPAFRVGYLVGPPDLLEEIGFLRRLIDFQGDAVLEQSIAELMAEGELPAHLKRARRHYQQRRDVFCDLLRQHLGEWFSFQEPAGG
ncbi:MAG: PLP-dependent aminotransferase family protein, partial [Hymenobacter sp.]|nr:PLP-dependent aminotransferase family protein [Hymenobacter sp.]